MKWGVAPRGIGALIDNPEVRSRPAGFDPPHGRGGRAVDETNPPHAAQR